MYLKISSGEGWPFYLGLNVLITITNVKQGANTGVAYDTADTLHT